MKYPLSSIGQRGEPGSIILFLTQAWKSSSPNPGAQCTTPVPSLLVTKSSAST